MHTISVMERGLVWASDKAETLIETIKKSTQEPSSDDLLDEIRRLNKELGQVPTRAEMTNRGSYTLDQYENTFDTWTQAVRKQVSLRVEHQAELHT